MKTGGLRPQICGCMKGYQLRQLQKDIQAGCLVAVIAFPLSVALAIASGMSPERGLYSAVIGGFFVSLFGGSRVNIGGATAATVMTVFTIVEEFGLPGLAVATVMAGIFLIIMGLCRFGVLLKFIPRTITLGFTAGIAVGIFSGQLKGFFGLEMGEMPVRAADKLIACARAFDTLSGPAFLIGLLSLAILAGLPKLTDRIPGSLAVILITTPLVAVTGMEVDTIRSVYGELPSHFPGFTAPAFSWELIESLIPSAMTLAILIAIVSLLACVVTDGLTGERHDSNQELIAEGIANLFCGCFGAVPVAGAVARASNSVACGGRTPVAGMVHSAAVLLILLFLMPLAGYIPIPALSAVLIMVAYQMSNWREFVYMAKHAPKSDFAVLIGTFLAGVLVDLLFAVEIGVIVSAVLFLRRATDLTWVREWDYEQEQQEAEESGKKTLMPVPPHTLVYDLEGPLIFATADVLNEIEMKPDARVLIIQMKHVPTVDISALQCMERLAKRCRDHQTELIITRVNPYPRSVMEKAGFLDKIGRERFCPDIEDALELAQRLVFAIDRQDSGKN